MRLAIAFGILTGLALFLMLRELLPAKPDLGDALLKLAGANAVPLDRSASPARTPQDRIGHLLITNANALSWARISPKDLRLLRVEPAAFLGEKALTALLGLVMPSLMSLLLHLSGRTLPLVIPIGGSLALCVAGWFVPDASLRTRATVERAEYVRAVAAYTDFTALQREAGTNATQALERAAQIGDTWIFRQLQEQMRIARYSGRHPWEGLKELSADLAVPELGELADIMKLAGEANAHVIEPLRARATGLRQALLANEHTAANEASERLVIPTAVLALAFLALLATPSMLTLL